jgi:hypothetical protein
MGRELKEERKVYLGQFVLFWDFARMQCKKVGSFSWSADRKTMQKRMRTRRHVHLARARDELLFSTVNQNNLSPLVVCCFNVVHACC